MTAWLLHPLPTPAHDANTVTLIQPCPSCRIVCAWYGARLEPGNGTGYRIDCHNCEDDDAAA